MNNKVYTELKEAKEAELQTLTDTALTETNPETLEILLEKINVANGKLTTLKQLFGKVNLSESGEQVIKDPDGAIQWIF